MNRTLTRGAAVSLAMIGIFSCSGDSVTGADNLNTGDLTADASRIATVAVSFGSNPIVVGDTTRATATLKDYQGRLLLNRLVTWTSSDSTVATVSPSGLVTGVAEGSALITASRAGKTGSGTISVTASIGGTGVTPVNSVRVSLAASSLNAGQTTQATATTYDSSNNVLTGRVVSWSSSNLAVATVTAAGLVTAVATGTSQITATSEGKNGNAVLTVTAPQQSTNPGTVTDLKVLSTDSTGATLSFTQVNDGTGLPAQYDVRYAPTPIGWGSATTATAGTCAVPIAGTAIGSSLVCKVLGLSPSTRYDFQLIAFRGTMNFNAVYGSLSNVATASTTASAAPPPPPPPPPPPGAAAEPAGMTRITEDAFSAVTEDGWYSEYGQTNIQLVQDATAPRSPSGVLQLTYPAGMTGGTGPNSLERDWSARTYKTLYVAAWMKVSSNFYGHCGPDVTKTLHIWVSDGSTGGNRLYTNVRGCGSGPLSYWVNLQGVVAGGNVDNGTSAEFAPNLGQPATIVRGQWQKYELVIKANSAGQADGTIDWWLDGVHVGSYTGIQYVPGAATWDLMKWNPTWGGLGGVVPAAFSESMDDIYISGKP